MASRATTTIPQIAGDLAKAGVDIDIVGPIGSGALGELFRASVNRRTVALKVFRPGAGVDVSVLERFVSGGEDSLRHPNLMPLLAVSSVDSSSRNGAGPGGARVFCTMPLLTGDPLEVVLADLEKGCAERPSLTALAVGPRGEIHSLLPRRAAQLFAEVADGLSLAHDRGIVHGRLHPGNLVFSPSGRLVITDFGQAPGSAEHAASGRETDFVPPEERGRTPPRASTAGDVYSLGAMLQRVLAHGDRLRGGEVPKPLAACVWKAMAREPRDRYERASDFAADLRRFLSDVEPHALLERDLFETEARRSESSRHRREHREQAAHLESATRLLAEERAGRDRLLYEIEEERRRRTQETQVRRAREAEMSALLRQRSRRFRWAAVAILSTTTALLVWALVESDLRREASEQALRVQERAERVRERASQIRALVETGDVARALEETRLADAQSPDDQVAGALTLLARNTAAKDALVGAVKAVADNRIDSAATAVRAAASFIEREDSGTLESLGLRLEQTAARDRVVTGLESTDERDHLVALDHLEMDLRRGSRPREDALLALRLAAPSPAPAGSGGTSRSGGPESPGLTVFRRVLRVASLAGASAPVLSRLRIGDDLPPVAIAEERFSALHDTLESIGDEEALALLCSWTAETRRALDTVPAPAQVFLAPNITVEIDRDEPRDYVERWFDLVVRHDARELLRAADDLSGIVALLPRLIDALASIDSEWSRALLARIVRTRPRLAGGEGLDALRRVGAFEDLLDIARGDYPLDVRRAALEALSRDLFPFCLAELKTIALTSPHGELRRAAFQALSRSDSPTAVSAIGQAVDDRDLRGPALEWLVRLPPERSSAEALALLEHPKGGVRRVAVSVLSAVSDARLLVPLTARLFAESPGVRAAALSLLKEKAALLGKQGHPEQPGDLVNRVLRALGYPFRRPSREGGLLGTIPPIGEWWDRTRDALLGTARGVLEAERGGPWIQALARRLRRANHSGEATAE